MRYMHLYAYMHSRTHNGITFGHKEEQNYAADENYHTTKLSQSLKGK